MSPKRKRPVARTPGRPRSSTSRQAILKAAYQILREGGFARLHRRRALPHGPAPARRRSTAGGRPRGTLAVEAFLVAVAPRMDAVKESASPIADLRRQVHVAATLYRGRVGQLLRELIALGPGRFRNRARAAQRLRGAAAPGGAATAATRAGHRRARARHGHRGAGRRAVGDRSSTACWSAACRWTAASSTSCSIWCSAARCRAHRELRAPRSSRRRTDRSRRRARGRPATRSR